MNSGDTHVDVSSFRDHIVEEPIEANVPLLLQNPPYRISKSFIYDELRNFRISLKWCALDHSTYIGKLMSYTIFILLTICVPILSYLTIEVPESASEEDPISFNKLVHLPESALAMIAFFTLSRFFRRYGLRQLLFLNDLQEDSPYVRQGYTRELDKAFRYLACILLPTFFIEIAHKIIFFSTVVVSIPYVHITSGVVLLNSMMLVLVLASWVYRTGVFLLVCGLFRLTCELQILRFEGFRDQLLDLEGFGSDAGVIIFEEHLRIRKQLSETSHRYRWFIIGCLVTTTVAQLGALLLVFETKTQKSFFNSGELVVCSAVQLSGFFLSLLGATRITHRAQGIVSVASRWHMLVTSASVNTKENTSPNQQNCGGSGFHSRQALVTYLQHNNGGITLFGYALDRGLLHTLFAFETSLVLWVLSKVVVLS
ncbi:hypothetical protein Acr_24g0017130 [Actinidia rufa]|uniref:Ras guanine nucleotide exchange factor K n=1 Tax=Actinidia rufa TaxID=165716 RepID=A0A7J0GXJ0_9ERIC|nr:hypothetical protein Acr_24g0017130 [Actinidia rufa]